MVRMDPEVDPLIRDFQNVVHGKREPVDTNPRPRCIRSCPGAIAAERVVEQRASLLTLAVEPEIQYCASLERSCD